MIRKVLKVSHDSGVTVIPGRRGPFTKRSAVNQATRHTKAKTVRLRPDIAAHRKQLAIHIAGLGIAHFLGRLGKYQRASLPRLRGRFVNGHKAVFGVMDECQTIRGVL